MTTADQQAGKSERHERGARILDQVHPEATAALVEALADVAPDLGAYVFEFAFGDVYDRPGLELQERQLLTLASLTTLGGCDPQLKTHVTGALELGISPKKIVEAVMHCLPYAGFPRVLNAIAVAKTVFADRELLPVTG